MARINIEECWWSDPRRSKLGIATGSQSLADGMALNAWRLALEFWSRGKLIPWHTYSALEGAEDLLKVGLARLHESEEPASKQIEPNASNLNECFIYVRGSSEYLQWARDRREAARAGGLKSADVRRRNTQANTKQNEAKPTKSNQTQPSSSSSSSNTNTFVPKKETTLLWNFYREELKKQKNLDSVRSGVKENTLCKNLVTEFGLERSKALILVFLKDEDPFVLDQAFQIGLLFSQRQKYLARLARSSPSATAYTFPDSTSEVTLA